MICSMPKHWKQELWLFAAIAALSWLAGALSGLLLPCLLAGLLLYLGWHLYQLTGLWQRLQDNRHGSSRAVGLWQALNNSLLEQHTAAQARLRELSYSLDRFRDTVNTLPDAVVILDAQQHIDWSNPAAGKLLGIDWPDAAGQPLGRLVTDPLLAEYLDSGEYAQPLVLNSPGNRCIILSLYVAPLKHAAKTQLLVARDITRQYHLDAVRRDFVANVSHELRTPLTVIMGLAEQLGLDSSDPVMQQRAIELLQQQAQRMNVLVTDLLTLSRLEMQHEATHEDSVAVPELLQSIAEEAVTLSGAARHDVQLQLDSHCGLRGDAGELRAAFGNLVANAIRHTPGGAHVMIRWREDSDGAHFSVTDTGEGIAARHIPRLTERLYRVDASRSRDTGGTGLGLAIVKHVLEHHDAALEINSKVGGGSTFSCHFPVERIIPLPG
jgi:two-component system phosphate regulon sensor histidine kinase PhoR